MPHVIISDLCVFHQSQSSLPSQTASWWFVPVNNKCQARNKNNTQHAMCTCADLPCISEWRSIVSTWSFWSSHCQSQCCVRVGSRWFPSTQPPLFAAPRYQAASARPGCCSGVKLKRTLQTFIQTCLKLSSSRQMQGVVGAAFL